MGDIMRQVPFRELIHWIFEEYKVSGSIFGIPESNFFRKTTQNRCRVFNEECDTPIGPAAGPHTQLTQNIICSYLSGGRFIELKTVQQMDDLEIEKPCIDATDEAFNTEWSTEFTLEKAYDEYLKAWIILYLLEEYFGLSDGKEKSFIFNMSVGYDLKGIQTPKMDRYINSLIDSSEHPLYKTYIKELGEYIEEMGCEKLQFLLQKISPHICKSVTLSTMHGCPPKEIEAICSYMLTEKKIDTFVKLNPTLLGYSTVREILDTLGFNYIELTEETFSHDLQYSDAIEMLKRLLDLAAENDLQFGVKLSNTLGVINNKDVLPGGEMYMSGRSLFPLTINLAYKLAKEFKGKIPVSYSGGASSINIKELFQTGIHPITMATDLLKPGGYMRMKEMAVELDKTSSSLWKRDTIDLKLLETLMKETLKSYYYQKSWRGEDNISVDKELPLYDCYIAPCIHACPIHQDVPEYIRLVGEKKYSEAMDVIYKKNPLPYITGYICDHQCMYNCTRLDYEGAVEIREMKKVAAENGWIDYLDQYKKPELIRDKKIAVIGAGPAGLSVAYFLTLEGFPVTIFEKEQSAGGVVQNILPNFRIPAKAIERDIEFIEKMGVNFKFGADQNLNINQLKNDGYSYICIAIGAEQGNSFSLSGNNSNIWESLDFLKQFKENPENLDVGRSIAVIGAGNTAMDSARAALKLKSTERVRIIYRRSEKEMPADREEYVAALEDGVKFHFLRNPSVFNQQLECTVMELGKTDDSGRRRPVATEETESFDVDCVITAIGEHVDNNSLKQLGLPADDVFLLGDAHIGSSTIVRCIADARETAGKILHQENISPVDNSAVLSTDLNAITERKGVLYTKIDGTQEAERCLECNYICNKCVDVCPNRANITIPNKDLKEGHFKDPYTILHIDAFCNECGNCGTFCPYKGTPYQDKLTLFHLEEDFNSSSNDGFLTSGKHLHLRLDGYLYHWEIGKRDIDTKDSKVLDTFSVVDNILENYTYLLGDVIP